MRSSRWALMAVCATIVLLSCSGAASAAGVNGWTSHSGPDYELFMNPSNEVGPSELVQLINYDIHDVTLELWQINGTRIMSQTVAPKSSAFIELDYGTKDCRIDLVSSYYGLEGSYTRLHKYEQLPPPSPGGGWVITPPDQSDPMTWTDAMVAALIESLTLQVLLAASAAALLGLLLGAGIKKMTLFTAPTDVFTMAVAAVSLSDLALDWSGLGIGLYHLPFICGYFVGFLIVSVPYVEVQTHDIRGRSTVTRPVVIYSPNDQMGLCIQAQTNKALLKRLCGIHHRLKADAGISPDWATSTKAPWLPKIRKMAVLLENEATEYETVPFLHVFQARQYSTQWRLSNASKLPQSLWMSSSSTIIWARDLVDRVYADLISERQRNKMLATQVAAEMHTYSIDRSTHRAVYDLFSQPVPSDRPAPAPKAEPIEEDEPEQEETDEDEQKNEKRK